MADKCRNAAIAACASSTRGIEQRRECGQCGFRYITRDVLRGRQPTKYYS